MTKKTSGSKTSHKTRSKPSSVETQVAASDTGLKSKKTTDRKRIVHLAVADLIPNENNPRQHPALHIRRIANSISAYGFNNPILIREDRTIVAGHGRRLAAIDLGIEKVPCIVLDHLTEEEALAYLLADNKTQEGAITDPDLEARNILALHQAGLDVLLAGYSQTEVDNALLAATKGDDGQDDPPPPPAEPVTKRGDLWILGGHRLVCGDSADSDVLDLLMDGQKAQLYSTDPPYGVGYDGTAHPQNQRDKDSGRQPGSQNRDWGEEYWDHYDSPEAFKDFLSSIFQNASHHVVDDAAWYCWHASSTTEQFLQAWREAGIRYHQTITWVKPTHVMGFTMWNYRTEPCLMGWRKGHKPAVHAVSDEHSNCWEVDWEGKKRSTDGVHPTQKPVRLFELPMLKHTKRNDICLETFSGSGSQFIAAEKLGRRCFGVERMPVFCDVIVRRWEAFTNQKAELVRPE